MGEMRLRLLIYNEKVRREYAGVVKSPEDWRGYLQRMFSNSRISFCSSVITYQRIHKVIELLHPYLH